MKYDADYDWDDYDEEWMYNEPGIDVYDKNFFDAMKKTATNTKPFLNISGWSNTICSKTNHIIYEEYNLSLDTFSYFIEFYLRNIKKIEKLSLIKECLLQDDLNDEVKRKYSNECNLILADLIIKDKKDSEKFNSALYRTLRLLKQTSVRRNIKELFVKYTKNDPRVVEGDLCRLEEALIFAIGRLIEIGMLLEDKHEHENYYLDGGHLADKQYIEVQTIFLADVMTNHRVISTIYQFCGFMVYTLKKEDPFMIRGVRIDRKCSIINKKYRWYEVKNLGYKLYTKQQIKGIKVFIKNFKGVGNILTK